jgi:RNA polymerase-binding transcription factor DksA
MPDKAEVRSRLTERLAILTAQVGRIEGELGRPLDDDFAEQAVDREGDEALDAVERAALVEIDLTRKTIARLDSGSYGICASCGDIIAAERLAALPTAAECISCARAPHGGTPHLV